MNLSLLVSMSSSGETDRPDGLVCYAKCLVGGEFAFDQVLAMLRRRQYMVFMSHLCVEALRKLTEQRIGLGRVGQLHRVRSNFRSRSVLNNLGSLRAGKAMKSVTHSQSGMTNFTKFTQNI